MSPRLIALAGPTAVGKTAAAVRLAHALEGEIVGADSVQVYRGFDIGSSKPRAEELAGVPHHMIDIVEPNDPVDAARFAALADRSIADILARGRTPIVVGGTGLWLRALLRGLVEVPPVDAELRARLERSWETRGPAAMYARLQQVDPKTAERVHPNDQVRVVRALEVYEQTGEALGELRARHALGAPRYEALCFVLTLPRAVLHERIRSRTRAMIEAGWVEETRGLLARYGPTPRAFGSVGYRQMAQHLQERIPLDETRDRIERATRLYAKRQLTWFNGDPDITARLEPRELDEPRWRERILRHLREDV